MRKYLRAANVTWNGLVVDDVKEMNFAPSEFDRYRLQLGDLVLAEGSGSPDEVGKPALWRDELPECCFQNTLIRVRAHSDVDPLFLMYLFWYEARSGNFGAASRGVNIHHIGAATLSDWPIPIPPIHEQRGIIAAIEEQLSRLDSSVESLRRAKRRLAVFRSSALNAAYRGIGPIRSFGDVCVQPQYGWTTRSLAKSHTVLLLRITDIQHRQVDWGTVPHCEEEPDDLSRFLLQSGDLVVARSGATVGKTFLLQNPPRAVFASYLIRLRPTEAILPEYLAWFCQTPTYWNQISAASSGMAQPNVNGRKLAAIKMPVPSIAVQRDAVSRIRHTTSVLEAVEDTLERGLRRAHALRGAVLAEAFSGRLVAVEKTADQTDHRQAPPLVESRV